MIFRRRVLILLLSCGVFVGSVLTARPLSAAEATAERQWLDLTGGADGAGKGKHVVLVAGSNEYGPETGLPMLGRVLSTHHGFDCTVHFTVDAQGAIDPNVINNIPGLEALDRADLLIICARFRTLPDEQMKHVVDYVESGRPVIGLRTATHCFAYPGDSKSPYFKYRWDNRDPSFEGGFGRQVLGETWIAHHAPNGRTSTRALFAPGAAGDPLLRGIHDGEIWGTTGAYGVRLPLLANCTTLLLGQVIDGPKPTDSPDFGKLNDPMMPVAWKRTYEITPGKSGRVLTTTMGSAEDLQSETLRRLLVNASYWATGLETRIPEKADVTLVDPPKPWKKGMKPADMQL